MILRARVHRLVLAFCGGDRFGRHESVRSTTSIPPGHQPRTCLRARISYSYSAKRYSVQRHSYSLVAENRETTLHRCSVLQRPRLIAVARIRVRVPGFALSTNTTNHLQCRRHESSLPWAKAHGWIPYLPFSAPEGRQHEAAESAVAPTGLCWWVESLPTAGAAGMELSPLRGCVTP